MTILEIFEKVNLVTPIEQRRFFNYYEDSVNELLSMYGDFVLDSAVIDEKGNRGGKGFSSTFPGN